MFSKKRNKRKIKVKEKKLSHKNSFKKEKRKMLNMLHYEKCIY